MTHPAGSAPIVLRPLRITTVTLVVFGVLFLGLGFFFILGPLVLEWSDPTSDKSDLSFLFALPLSVPLAVIGLFLIIRTPQIKLVLTTTEAILVNMFRTYRIPRKLVTGLGYAVNINANFSPVIEWKNPKSKTRGRTSTKVSFLAPAAVGSLGQSKLDAMTETVREWCEKP